jgi:hypothetical protein
MSRPATRSAASLPAFSNIINLLFLPPASYAGKFSDSSVVSQPSASQTVDARIEDVQIADAQTADAIIRSMFSSAGNVASATVSTRMAPHAASDSKPQAASNARPPSNPRPTDTYSLPPARITPPPVTAPGPLPGPPQTASRSAAESKAQSASNPQAREDDPSSMPISPKVTSPTSGPPQTALRSAPEPKSQALSNAQRSSNPRSAEVPALVTTPPPAPAPPQTDTGVVPNSKSPTAMKTQPSSYPSPAEDLSSATLPQAGTALVPPMDTARAPVVAAEATPESAPKPVANPVLSPSGLLPSAMVVSPGIPRARAATPATPTPPMNTARAPGPAAELVPGRNGLKLAWGAAANVVTSKAPPASPPALAFGMRLTQSETPESSATSPQTSLTSAASQPSAAAATTISPSLAAPPTQPQNPADANPADANQGDADQAGPSRTATPELASRSDAEVPIETGAPQVASAAIAAAAPATDVVSNNFSGDFARESPGSAPNPAFFETGAKMQAAPALCVAEVLRKAEPAASASPAPSSAPAQQISMRIAPPQGSSGNIPVVDIHMMERAGQVHVAVRTADGGLQTSLRQDLGTLVNSLDRSGFRAETFTPREVLPPASAGTPADSQNSRQESPSGSGGRGGNSGDTSQNPSQNQGGGQPQQRSRDQRSQKWIEELENLK